MKVLIFNFFDMKRLVRRLFAMDVALVRAMRGLAIECVYACVRLSLSNLPLLIGRSTSGEAQNVIATL